ncbi:DUF6263 family protein [Corynebacterium pilosum]|uniref:Putative secreted protein n=1 Tax=Corynebacterium pilosum TaxID=35756 RepID=A0A376CJD8_9CORY|nr:DUF6263 family protein [Corynebacterium pilosum]STC68297.1 putative secreted protein [Corynebacterium pilosum]
MSIRHKAPALLIPVALASTLAACGGEPDPVAEVPAFPVDVARVEVVEAGTDPQVLSYNDVGGEEESSTRTVTTETGFDQNVVASDAVDPAAQPTEETDALTLPLEVRTLEAPAAGEGELDASRRVELRVADDVSADLASATGFLSVWRGTDDGRVSTVKLLAPEEATEDARATVESALMSVLSSTVIFPSDAVGVGGSWTVESRVTGGSTMLRTTTYTVTDIQGDQVMLDVVVDQRPAQETLNFDAETAPDLAGQSLTVESSDTVAEGSLTVDRTEALPVDGAASASTRVVYAGADEDFRIVQDYTEKVNWS